MAIHDYLHVATARPSLQALSNGHAKSAEASPAVMGPVGKGYAHMPDLVLFHQDPELTPTARTLYGVLLAHKNRETGLCFPGEECLAAELGRDERNVRRALRVLERLRWIAVERSRYDPKADKRPRTNHYTFLLDNTENFTALHAHVLCDETLPVTAKYGYALVAHRQRWDGQTCHHSLAEIAKEAGISERTLKRWLAPLRRAGYLDSTHRIFGHAAERHVTFLRPEPGGRRVRARCLDKNGVGASVKAAPLNANGTDMSGPNGTDMSGPNGSFMSGAIGTDMPCKLDPRNQTHDNQTPLPRPRPASSSPEALNQNPPAEGGAAKPRNDASAALGACGTPGSAKGAASNGRGTPSLRAPLPSSDCVVQTAFVEHLVHGERVVLPQGAPPALHPSSGPSCPNGQPATGLAVKTKDKTARVRLRELNLAERPDPEGAPLWEQFRWDADWAARHFIHVVFGWKEPKLTTLEAYRDICGYILACMNDDCALFDEFCRYLAYDERYFRDRTHEKYAGHYWHKSPRHMYAEFYWWRGQAPRPKKRSTASYQDLGHGGYDGCLGCLYSQEEHARHDARKPGQQHRPDCLYGRRGPVGPDDWRTAVLVVALQEKEQ